MPELKPYVPGGRTFQPCLGSRLLWKHDTGENGVSMIILRPTNLHWMDGSLDNAEGLCAHSGIDFRIGDSVLVRPSDGDWTVSAAALYLLQTLSQSHTKQHPITEYLFPCCGNGIFEVEGNRMFKLSVVTPESTLKFCESMTRSS